MKKNILAILMAMVMVLSLVGCGTAKPAETTAATQAPTAAATEAATEAVAEEVTSTMVETLYAPNFSIEKFSDGIKKVVDGEGRELILVPKTMEEVPAEYAESIVIRTPVDNAVFLSDTQVCFFRDAAPEVLAGVGGISGTKESFAGFDALGAAMDAGEIVSVGGGMGDPDYELIQSLNPDVVFVYTGEWGQWSVIEKLDELGIPYAVDNEYLETDYMARMEWGRFIMTFFDADETIDAQMMNAQKTLDEVKAAIEGLEQPKVAIFNIYDGNVSATSDTSWLGTMLKDMGVQNVFSGMEPGALTMEAGFEMIQDADVIIYSSNPMWCNGMEGVLEAFPLLTDCKAYETGRVYQYTDAFWTGIDQTDIMAADLAAVAYPEQFADRTLSYFVQLEK